MLESIHFYPVNSHSRLTADWQAEMAGLFVHNPEAFECMPQVSHCCTMSSKVVTHGWIVLGTFSLLNSRSAVFFTLVQWLATDPTPSYFILYLIRPKIFEMQMLESECSAVQRDDTCVALQGLDQTGVLVRGSVAPWKKRLRRKRI